jgi:hypothetical protein
MAAGLVVVVLLKFCIVGELGREHGFFDDCMKIGLCTVMMVI